MSTSETKPQAPSEILRSVAIGLTGFAVAFATGITVLAFANLLTH